MNLAVIKKILIYIFVIVWSMCLVTCKSKALDNTYRNNSNTISNTKAEPEDQMFLEIEKRLDKSNITTLVDKEISSGELELRIWSGFDSLPLRGIMLRQSNSNAGEAIYIKPLRIQKVINLDGSIERKEERETIIKLVKPKSGWNEIWKSFEELEIKTLPDWRDINLKSSEFHGTSVIIEIKTKDNYRTYGSFGFNTSTDEKQVRNVLRFCNLLSEEFDIFLLRK